MLAMLRSSPLRRPGSKSAEDREQFGDYIKARCKITKIAKEEAGVKAEWTGETMPTSSNTSSNSGRCESSGYAGKSGRTTSTCARARRNEAMTRFSRTCRYPIRN